MDEGDALARVRRLGELATSSSTASGERRSKKRKAHVVDAASAVGEVRLRLPASPSPIPGVDTRAAGLRELSTGHTAWRPVQAAEVEGEAALDGSSSDRAGATCRSDLSQLARLISVRAPAALQRGVQRRTVGEAERWMLHTPSLHHGSASAGICCSAAAQGASRPNRRLRVSRQRAHTTTLCGEVAKLSACGKLRAKGSYRHVMVYTETRGSVWAGGRVHTPSRVAHPSGGSFTYYETRPHRSRWSKQRSPCATVAVFARTAPATGTATTSRTMATGWARRWRTTRG